MVKEGYSKISPVKFALAAGIIMAAVVLIITLGAIANIMGGFPLLISLINDIYGRIGYATTYLGALLGAIYIFVDTFVLTWIFAWLYNKLID